MGREPPSDRSKDSGHYAPHQFRDSAAIVSTAYLLLQHAIRSAASEPETTAA
jgi:hypothetical protein